MEEIGTKCTGLYLKKYPKGSYGLPVKLPRRNLFHTDIMKYVKKWKIPLFIDVFISDSLPTSQPQISECAVVN